MISPQESYRRNKERALNPPVKTRRKVGYVGVPAVFKLELACRQINEAFGGGRFGQCYLVGSALQRPDWRDIDVVCILDDVAFAGLFPGVHEPGGSHGYFEHDARWLLITIALSDWLTRQVGEPVDFKFQPMTFANARHDGPRDPLGFYYTR